MKSFTRTSHPAVSVITPCLNGIAYLPQMVASVIAQTFSDWELIFIDDGSTDGSLEYMIEAASQEQRIVVKHTTGRVGAAAARNIGISSARGQYVAFLDCDDWWLPDKLARQITCMEQTGAAFSCAAYIVYDHSGKVIRKQSVYGPLTSRRHLHKQIIVGCLTVMYDRIQLPVAAFVTELNRAEDYLLWYELLLQVERLGMATCVIEDALACYRAHSGGKSSNKYRHALAHWRIYRDYLGFSVPKAGACLLSYAANGIFNRCTILPRFK
ncbi:MAG: glycosyltransferase family 2 protein [Pseudomonadota bacterium]